MLHRRDAMIRLGQLGVGSLTLPGLLGAEKLQAAESANPRLIPTSGKAKSCILIYLWGGPPQMDMWDPNPQAPLGVRSLFEPIATAVPDIQICDAMPLFARHTDKTAIIRSLTHESNAHEESVYRTLTGKKDPILPVPRNDRKRADSPNLGSVVSYFCPVTGMPAAATIPRPIGHGGVTYSGTYAGYLGAKHDPLEVAAARGTQGLPPLPLNLPKEITNSRLLARRGLLSSLEQMDRQYQISPQAQEFDQFHEMAFSMLGSSPVAHALQLDHVDDKTRDRYGRNEWGEAILTARRLVEAGMRLVTISWMLVNGNNVSNVWDNHGNSGTSGYQMLQSEYCLPSLDRASSALLEDLSESGLLDETLVAMYGEFGRTPKINKNSGRDHWGACQSAHTRRRRYSRRTGIRKQ